MRHGLLTWAYQFAHVSLSTETERGNWTAWVVETNELDASGFYGGWRINEQAARDAIRGKVAQARADLARGVDVVGTDSSQANSSFAAVEALIELVAGNWPAAMALTRRSWVNADNADFPMNTGALAATAANRPDWARETLAQFDSFVRRGTLISGLRALHLTTVALLEGRWVDARSAYLDARRDLYRG